MAFFREIKAWIVAGGKFYSLYLLITALMIVVAVPMAFLLPGWGTTVLLAASVVHLVTTVTFSWLDKRRRENKILAARVMAAIKEGNGEKD
jgi:hypothetical protein